jgi:hypothetical protein
MAVRSPHRAFRFLEALGYSDGPQIFDPLQAVHMAMRHHPDMPDVELIWPGEEGPSPIDKLIRPSSGQIYHLCYAADDPERALHAVEAAGLSALHLTEAIPAPLFGAASVSFHHIEGFGLIEIIHPVR